MRCICCGNDLPNIPGTINQPSGGLEFVTHGHYGTTVFDPMDGSLLRVNVCDNCLRKAMSHGDTMITELGFKNESDDETPETPTS